MLHEHQPVQVILVGKRGSLGRAVFLYPARDIAGHADVERTERFVREDVDPAFSHTGGVARGWLRKR